MLPPRFGPRIVLIASLVATASVTSATIIQNEHAEAAVTGTGSRSDDPFKPVRSRMGKPPTTTTTIPATTTTRPATTTTTTTTVVAPTIPATVVTTPPANTSFSLQFLPSGSMNGWSMESSDTRETMSNDGTRVTCEIGGFDASTHYARLRRKLPETDNFAPRGPFTIGADIELPGDFYTQAESYVRFITTDNYPGTMRATGQKVGAASADEWRVGFLIYGSDQLPRLVSEHENRETMVLWTGNSRLPTGSNSISVDFTPSQGAEGAFKLAINGQVVAAVSGVRTVPTTLSPAEVVVTRVGTCLDGASKQDTRRLTTHVRSFSFVAQR